ncbi:MAG: rod shape-determining protein RodA [Clostridiales Family XIII bacterium]|nr:rod shape-determining protein RodA [Clostridiales Family XIII bacterium]
MGKIADILKRLDPFILAIPFLLGIISVLMISSITASGDDPLNRTVAIQGIAYILGFLLMVLVVYVDYRVFAALRLQLYIGAIALQLIVYIPGVGVEIAGQRAWVNVFGFTTMQPSELTKVLLILIMASYLQDKKGKLESYREFFKAFAYVLPIIAVVAAEDMGAAIVMLFIHIGMIFAAGLKAGIFVRLSALFVVSIPILYRFMQPHQKERFTAFLHPDNLSINATYQVYQSKVAIGSGGFLGKGFRQGDVKASGLLPVQESDFIFPVLCEEFGIIGGLVVIALYALLLQRIWVAIRSASEVFGALVCAGILCMFGFQIFENIGMTMGLMPVTGITLPFLSQGGSSILVNMLCIGLVLSVGFREKSRAIRYV